MFYWKAHVREGRISGMVIIRTRLLTIYYVADAIGCKVFLVRCNGDITWRVFAPYFVSKGPSEYKCNSDTKQLQQTYGAGRNKIIQKALTKGRVLRRRESSPALLAHLLDSVYIFDENTATLVDHIDMLVGEVGVFNEHVDIFDGLVDISDEQGKLLVEQVHGWKN